MIGRIDLNSIASRVLSLDDDFEAKHPREADGKFGAGAGDGGDRKYVRLKPQAVTAALKSAKLQSSLNHPRMGPAYNRQGYKVHQHSPTTVRVHTELDSGASRDEYLAQSRLYEEALTAAGFDVSRRVDASPELLFVRKAE
jgi:hypothetical protein